MDIALLVTRAAAGDQQAWRDLVDRYSVLVWRVARSHRLDDADAADVCQNTWIALAERIGVLHSPRRVSAWLVTTARRESLKVLAHRRREVRASAWPEDPDNAREDSWPEPTALRGDRDDALWRAFAALPHRCRALLGLMAFEPELSHVQISRAVGLAPTSIGRTRGRCVDHLRRGLVAIGLTGEVAR